MPGENSPSSLSELKHALAGLGMNLFGGLQLPDGRTGILVGNIGGAMWEAFSHSAEAIDGKNNPLDRWTRRHIEELAMSLECEACFPFDQPYPRFQQYAVEATGLRQSPLGILIHPEFGLWHAYRALLVFTDVHSLSVEVEKLIQQAHELIHPCDQCVEKPCLSACPVSAFTSSGLDVTRCFSHIDTRIDPDCMLSGCAARNACPVGKGYRYSSDQIEFHMRSYRGH